MCASLLSLRRIAACASLLAGAAMVQPANANLVQNGSFENISPSVTVTTSFASAGVADWSTSTLGQAIVLPNWYYSGQIFPGVGFAGAVPQTSPDGGNWVISDATYLTGAITQTVNGLNPGDTYDLTFYQGMAQDTENITPPGYVTGQWEVSLGGGSPQYGAAMSADGSVPYFTNWSQQSMSFTATSASEVLSFFAIGTGVPPLVFLDGVDLEDASAPEPATIWLSAIAVTVLGWKLRALRRQTNQG